jgi:hypothetical protein
MSTVQSIRVSPYFPLDFFNSIQTCFHLWLQFSFGGWGCVVGRSGIYFFFLIKKIEEKHTWCVGVCVSKEDVKFPCLRNKQQQNKISFWMVPWSLAQPLISFPKRIFRWGQFKHKFEPHHLHMLRKVVCLFVMFDISRRVTPIALHS